ncbi:MAG: DUF4159 domain-containing protein, partial [Bryobacteraceae bacterium]
MDLRKTWAPIGAALLIGGGLYAFQRPFHQYPGVEYQRFELPEDYRQPGEWAFARLMYPPGPLDGYY